MIYNFCRRASSSCRLSNFLGGDVAMEMESMLRENGLFRGLVFFGRSGCSSLVILKARNCNERVS